MSEPNPDLARQAALFRHGLIAEPVRLGPGAAIGAEVTDRSRCKMPKGASPSARLEPPSGPCYMAKVSALTRTQR